jgi:hypothetical protein
MPKKAKSTATAAASATTDAWTKYCAEMDKVMNRVGATHRVMIVGVNKKDQSDDDEDKPHVYTQKEVDPVRHVLLTARRKKLLLKKNQLGSWDNDDDYMGDTRRGDLTILAIPKLVKALLKKKTAGERFDSLFALTSALNDDEGWMHSSSSTYNSEMEAAVELLGKTWKQLLSMSDADLEVDSEFTRPGIQALLKQFAGKLGGAEHIETKLKWD